MGQTGHLLVDNASNVKINRNPNCYWMTYVLGALILGLFQPFVDYIVELYLTEWNIPFFFYLQSKLLFFSSINLILVFLIHSYMISRCPTHNVLFFLFCCSSFCVPYAVSFSVLSILIAPLVFSNVNLKLIPFIKQSSL